MNNSFHNTGGRYPAGAAGYASSFMRHILRLKNSIFLLLLLILSPCFTGAQEPTVTLNVKDVPLEQVMAQLRRQTGYNFVYGPQAKEKARKVTLNIERKPLREALDLIFKAQDLTYTFRNKSVIITTKTAGKAGLPAEKRSVHGKVTDSLGNALAGVTIMISGTTNGTSTTQDGYYSVNNVAEGALLDFSLMGYEARKLTADNNQLNVVLYTTANLLNMVTVKPVSTGYQNLPKERATGSFTQIDSNLLQRGTSTNITDRLNGIANGLILNNGSRGFNTPGISIRGRSTILGNANPLIVLDNFPYGGDINAINPNDIESITLLKDAAAASIWGTQAGNGVLVITTKSGRYNQKTTINVTSNVTIGQKPRLLTQRQMSSAEFIEVETFLFDKGAYNSIINNGYGALSPAVEILLMHRNNQVGLERRNAMLDSLTQYDIRNDRLKYLYRIPINQQYNLNIGGGTATQKYFLSAGYDKNLLTEVGNSFERFSLNGQNTYNLFNGKLQLTSGLLLSTTQTNTSKGSNAAAYKWPYLQLADAAGNHLAVANDLRFSYISAQNGKGLLDWYYRPLDELDPSSFTNSLNLRLQNTLIYRIIPQLSISAYHTYQKGITNTDNYNYANAYYTRNLINSLSTINSSTGMVTRPVAEGDILNNSRSTLTGQYGRLQVNFEHTLAQKHNINAIAGAEISEYKTDNAGYTLYGYNPQTGANANASINYTQSYPKYTGGSMTVPNGISNNGLTDHNISYYGNAAYTYNQRYTLSASARKDQSNIFGVKANQKGVPLWSVGGLWHISREPFYKINWLPALALRTTYGYNGNVDKSTSAYFTTQLIGYPNDYGLPQYQINNPPNPSLRWEKVSNINLGIEFATIKNRISGSIEYYVKNGQDLIGLSPIAPQTGITQYRGNNADLKTQGVDLRLSSRNLTGQLQWQTTFLLNYAKDKVTSYNATPGSNGSIVNGTAYLTPLVGYPYNAWFAYRWAGLDATGAPQSYLNGTVSTNYNSIVNSLDRTELLYMGSAVPTLFGSLLNNFSYKNWQLSALISYKAGYVIKYNSSLSNSGIYSAANISYTVNADYSKRWQKPGDEASTDVPALIYPANSNRDAIYTNSELLIYSGNHVRLQDIRLSYNAGTKLLRRLSVKNLNLFAYATNLGLLWQANKAGIDPDSPNMKQSRSIAFGLNARF